MADEIKNTKELSDEELNEISGGKLNIGKRWGFRRKTLLSSYIIAKNGITNEEIPEGWIKWECPKCPTVIWTPAETTIEPVCPDHKGKCMKVKTSISF